MPVLTRRRDPDAQQETWLIHYGDTHIGTITLHAGVGGVDRWAWSCAFYPASHRGVRADGQRQDLRRCPRCFRRGLASAVARDYQEGLRRTSTLSCTGSMEERDVERWLQAAGAGRG